MKVIRIIKDIENGSFRSKVDLLQCLKVNGEKKVSKNIWAARSLTPEQPPGKTLKQIIDTVQQDLNPEPLVVAGKIYISQTQSEQRMKAFLNVLFR